MPPYGSYGGGAPNRHRTNGNDMPSPVTPAVTGIDYPSNEDVSVEADLYRHYPPAPRYGAGGGHTSSQSQSQSQSQSYSLSAQTVDTKTHSHAHSRSQSHSQSRKAGQNSTGNGLYTHPNTAGSTLDDASPPADRRAIDDVWGLIREQKEKKMAREKPKVQSLEEMAQELVISDSNGNGGYASRIPVMEAASPPPATNRHPQHNLSVSSPPPQTGRSVKRKSISNFRESTDGRAMVATFDLPDVDKQDIHISFQRTRLVLTWEVAELAEWEEKGGVVYREFTKKMYNRTLPLPEGTKFEEIQAQMTSRGLILRYPNMRCFRVDGRSRSGDSY